MTVKINPEALENAAKRLALIMSYGERDMHWRALDDRQKQITTRYAREVVTKALGRLNADTLRHLPQVQELMVEAWEDGAQAAWGASGEGWNGEYAERPGPPGVFRAQNPTFPNPHLGGDA